MKDEMLTNDISFLLSQIRGIPFLTKEEQSDLSIKVQTGEVAKNKLKSGGVATAEEELETLASIQIGKEAKDKFITSNMLLVVSIAKKYSYKGIDLMELIQEGTFGLMRAAEKFDASRGVKFTTYASYWVSRFMTKYINKTSGMLYVPNHAVQKLNKYCRIYDGLQMDVTGGFDTEFVEVGTTEMGGKDFKSAEDLYKVTQKMFSLHETIRGSEFIFEDIILEEEAENLEDRIILKLDMTTAINETLIDEERTVISRRFGTNGSAIFTISEIAAELGKTKDKIRKIEKTALNKLKEFLISVDYGV